MPRLFGNTDKVTEASEVLTLIRSSIAGGGAAGHSSLSLDSTVADVLDISVAQVLSMDSAVTRGDIVYADSTPKWTRLALGSTSQHLESDNTDISWVTNLTMANNAWIGISGTGARAVFVSAGNAVSFRSAADAIWYSDDGVTEQARVDGTAGHITTEGDLTFNDAAAGVIHQDNTAGKVLRADGSRYVPNDIQSADLPDNSANPTASVALTAVNGTATTWMRSDAAPVLSQAIAPTWTGRHYWSRTVNALAGLADRTNYHLMCFNPGNDDGEMAALGFYISAATTNVGAAIGFERTDGNSKGKLGFYTKQVTTDAVVPALVLTLGDDGVAIFEDDVRFNAAARGIVHDGGNTNEYVLMANGTRYLPAALFDATNPTSIDVGDAAAVGTASVAPRRDHQHAVNSSSNPGAAASLLATDSNGYVQVERLGANVAPSYLVHLRRNSATTATLMIEQDGSGDAVIGWDIAAATDWTMGVDNSDADKFKIESDSGLGGANPPFCMTTAGNVGHGDDNPTRKLTVYHPTDDIILKVQSGDAKCGIEMTDSTATAQIYAQGSQIRFDPTATGTPELALSTGSLYPWTTKGLNLGNASGRWNGFWRDSETAGSSRIINSTKMCPIPGCGVKMVKSTGTTTYTGEDADYELVFCPQCGNMAVEERVYHTAETLAQRGPPPKVTLLNVWVQALSGHNYNVRLDFEYGSDEDGKPIRNSTRFGDDELEQFQNSTLAERRELIRRLGEREWYAHREMMIMEEAVKTMKGQVRTLAADLIGKDLLTL